MLLFLEGIFTFLIGMFFGKNFDKKIFKLLTFLFSFCYLFAVFIDPFLPFPYTPKTLELSFFVNTFIYSLFLLGLTLGKNHFRKKSKEGSEE